MPNSSQLASFVYPIDDGGAIFVPQPMPTRAIRTQVCDSGACDLVHLWIQKIEPRADGHVDVPPPSPNSAQWFNTRTGEVGPEESPNAVWLAEHLSLIEAQIRGRYERGRAAADKEAWRRFAWGTVEVGIMLQRRDVFPADWDSAVVLDGRYYLADDLHCVVPSCGCADVVVALAEVKDGRLHDVGRVNLSVEGGVVAGERFDNDLSRRVWARLKEDGMTERLPEHRARMRSAAQAAQDEGLANFDPVDVAYAEPFRSGVKVGRNAPCPCGSGKKYKRCCLRAESP